ncbi:hypothetical protein DSM112329_02817 [Paraconexibacter sp. AEG42_29]|uniref:Uncharacterized protein n=1 Tax=Paraconexibacter sp. AEG42_29 TaxID=2997339 RepID=A0AAU7AW54_9ACTN
MVRAGRAFDEAVKSAAVAHGWRTGGGGFLYRVQGDYIYELSVTNRRERGETRGRLSVKPMGVDPVFWEVVGLSELTKKRAGFRLAGAFTLRLATVAEMARPTGDDETVTATQVVHDLQAAFGQHRADY